MRVRWSAGEVKELERYAAKYLRMRKTPTREVCLTFLKKSKEDGGELHRRSADKLVKKISALNVKARNIDSEKGN